MYKGKKRNRAIEIREEDDVLEWGKNKKLVERIFMYKELIVVIGILIWLPTIGSAGLVSDMQSAPYDPSSYELHVFDCSNMAAIMEAHMNDQGYDATIIVIHPEGKQIGHAMVVVYVGWVAYLIEPVYKEYRSELPYGYQMEDIVGEYEDVVDAADNSIYPVSEWGIEFYLERREME